MTRPKRTRKDSNHAEVRDALREAGLIVLDVADLPGSRQHNPLDLIVLDPYRGRRPPVIVAASADGVKRWFAAHPLAAMVQVEIKPSADASFTDDERAYLESLNLWPPEVWG